MMQKEHKEVTAHPRSTWHESDGYKSAFLSAQQEQKASEAKLPRQILCGMGQDPGFQAKPNANFSTQEIQAHPLRMGAWEQVIANDFNSIIQATVLRSLGGISMIECSIETRW